MRRFRKGLIGRFLALLAMLWALALPASAGGAGSSFGIYGTRWTPWILKNASSVGFALYQLPYDATDADLTVIDALADEGVEVVVVQNLYPSNDERFMRPGHKPLREVSEVAGHIVRLLADPRMASVTAVSLDEENVWMGGRGEYLADLYRSVKMRRPDSTVLQWFADSPTSRDPLGPRYAVPADGYIFDAYHLALYDYERRVASYAANAMRLVGVLWASPTWVYGERQEGRQLDWWDREGWRELYAKTMINRRWGVRTAFFMYDLPEGGGRVVPTFASGDACSEAFVRKFFDRTLPMLARLNPDEPVPEERPAWFAERCPDPH